MKGRVKTLILASGNILRILINGIVIAEVIILIVTIC